MERFINNTIPLLSALDVTELTKLREFLNNNLENVTELSLPVNLVDFSANSLSKLAKLNLTDLDTLTTLNNNNIPNLPDIKLENKALTSFYNNTFQELTSMTILGNNFTRIVISNFSKL